jgi:TRAP-type C4-dicarboxylate transport system permease small subunit
VEHGKLKKLLYVIDRILYYFLAILLVALVLLLSINILFRFVFLLPIHWTEEISMLLFIWIIFMGSAVVQKRDGHVSIEIVYNNCPPLARKIMKITGQVLVLFVLVIMTVLSMKLVRFQYHSLTASLMLPYSVFSLTMLLSVILMLIYTTISIVDNIRAFRENKGLQTEGASDTQERISS